MSVAYMVPNGHLANVLKLAIGNGIRTPDEQQRLVELARMVRSECEPFWAIVDEVEQSWTGSPCRRCELPAEPGESMCETCHDRIVEFAAEQRADHLMDLVQR